MVFATERFALLTSSAANSLGLLEARIVVVPHPLGGTDQSTVIAWADAAVGRLAALIGV